VEALVGLSQASGLLVRVASLPFATLALIREAILDSSLGADGPVRSASFAPAAVCIILHLGLEALAEEGVARLIHVRRACFVDQWMTSIQ
jgi:hypothetical protein